MQTVFLMGVIRLLSWGWLTSAFQKVQRSLNSTFQTNLIDIRQLSSHCTAPIRSMQSLSSSRFLISLRCKPTISSHRTRSSKWGLSNSSYRRLPRQCSVQSHSVSSVLSSLYLCFVIFSMLELSLHGQAIHSLRIGLLRVFKTLNAHPGIRIPRHTIHSLTGLRFTQTLLHRISQLSQLLHR